MVIFDNADILAMMWLGLFVGLVAVVTLAHWFIQSRRPTRRPMARYRRLIP